MGHAYRTKPEPKDGSFGFTFPDLNAELEPHMVRDSKLERPLNRIARQLMKQHPKVNGKKVVGVEFSSIQFHFILDPEKGDP